MAQKRKKHGKVEARQVKARVRFKPGVLVIIILLTFAACFAMYISNASRQPDYWEREIVANMEDGASDSASNQNNKRKNVTNPVPSSERADDSRMAEVAFIGDVAAFAAHYDTTSGMVFTDAVTNMAESRMRSIARSLRGTSPKAVYIWYQCPDDLEAAADSCEALVDNIIQQIPDTPIYVLTSTPASNAQDNQKNDTWNASLFAMADELGLLYIDVSTTLKANDGTLAAAYTDEETFYNTIGDQILTHVAD